MSIDIIKKPLMFWNNDKITLKRPKQNINDDKKLVVTDLRRFFTIHQEKDFVNFQEMI